jgi:hypothetical protein
MSPSRIEIPRSVKTEHDAIHALLYPAAILVGDVIRARLRSA